MLSLLLLALLARCSGVSVADPSLAEAPLDWWQNITVYQIYPRSYKDSDGDGIGDLKGITSRLEHIKDAGCGALWLSPIYASPMKDFGYDISNQTLIDPIFGNLDDFKALQKKSKELGLKLILDFVPDYSSDQHIWFKKSVKKIDPYTDYYVWHDGKIDNATGKRTPPNNWVSAFKGSAWAWNEERQQYYYHVFTVQQPDLNYRNKHLVEDMKDVLRYWLRLGVDGFRVDSIPHLFEDTRFLDEPLTHTPGLQPTDYDYTEHVFTQNLPETYDMVHQFRRVLDEFRAADNHTRLMMTEAYANISQMMGYYGTDEKPGAHFTFNFLPIMHLSRSSTAQNFSDVIFEWLDNVPKGRWSNWVFGNHDQPRVASRFGSDLADGINTLLTLLPGTAISYMGEELAMTNTFLTWNQTVDPQGLNAGPQNYSSFSRDPERTPFQWDNSTSAGFSSNPRTWLPVNPNYKTLNLAAEAAAPTSHYKVYQQLNQLRRSRTVQRGSLTVRVVSEWVLAFTRELAGEDTVLAAVNLGPSESTVDLTQHFSGLPQMATVATASVNSGLRRGDKSSPASLKLKGKATVVLTSGQVSGSS
ncbi:maltase A1-like [Bacillus rossius redtenbacheri]|uniref:maltase A1-like n=1 Tax=Bacillus rossius redtenbacheri TaxID=93214 RepID=UPI002FDDAE57